MTNSHEKNQTPPKAILDAQLAQRRYRDLAEGIDHGIVWEADQDLHFQMVSRRAQQLLGYPLDQWYSEPNFWRSHLHPDDRDRVLSLFQKAAEGTDQASDHRMIAKDGRIVWFHTGIHATFDEERRVYRGLSVDISYLKEIEEKLKEKTKEAQEASQAKSYFLSVASH